MIAPKNTCRILWDRVPPAYKEAIVFSDYRSAYQAVIPSEQHRPVGEETGETAHIERWNNTLRKQLARFLRKTLSFPKIIAGPVTGPMFSSFMTTINAGLITLGASRETSAFVCDAIDRAEHYPHAQEILLTFDAGTANAARSLRFKEDLVALSRRLGLRLRVALYPPYTSKWHPIEHRLFSHGECRLSGVILDSHQTALESVQRTHTQTGLTVTPRLLDTLYEPGRKCSETFLDINDKFIRHDPVLRK